MRSFERLSGYCLPILILLLLAGCGLGGHARYTREEIQAIISTESPVLYRDGVTRIGVFFDQEHRDYVPYAQIPKACVDAVVAAEDDQFYKHNGVDPWGILRAIVVNIKSGRVVQGGSTLTQQTAKNLFYRPDRSWRSKLTELSNALDLERSFTKQEILEFYLNQFHVSGNGRGIGIAARYFFDKPVQDLSVQECAFVAGMVKGPARYNPWTGKTEADRAQATERARIRASYVLRRMNEEGYLDDATFGKLQDLPVPFRRGTFRYDRLVALDEVEALLAAPPFSVILHEAGLDQAGTSGLQVVTTLDRDTQVAATYGLWHHLTELGTQLEGLKARDFILPADALSPDSNQDPLMPRQFQIARVKGATGKGKGRGLKVEAGGGACLVDNAGLSRIVGLLKSSSKDIDVEGLLSTLKPESLVLVSVRSVEKSGALCDLEVRPRLQGALVVLDRGRIRAMVGGNTDQNFNRVSQSKRQFGSTWKSLVYQAALQLGWLPTDILDNRRSCFTFEGTYYWPRPDHEPEPAVSLGWAGTRSENIASTWLLYHLVDRLDDEGIRTLAREVDLSPRPGEDGRAWVARIRDRWGVISTEDRKEEALFEGARREALSSLSTGGHPEDAFELGSLLFGRGFEAERKKAASSAPNERKWRLAALNRSFLHLEERGATCRAQAAVLMDASYLGEVPQARDIDQLAWRASDGKILCLEGVLPQGLERVGTWFADPTFELGSRTPVDPADVLVDGIVHLSSIEGLRRSLDRRRAVFEGVDPWDERVVLQHPDFRRLLGMRYVALLAGRLGVADDLPPVLSLPLGAVEVSLLDIANVYQGFLEGASWRFPGLAWQEGIVPGIRSKTRIGASTSPNLLIQEIRDRDGNVIYRAESERIDAVDPVAGRQVMDILRNVVLWGTGRRARDAVSVSGTPWPLMGKTGTTNGYRNAAFVGFVPVGPGDPSARADGALTVAAYVGYDDNAPMKKGSLRVAGASGALPAWIGTVEGMARSGVLRSKDWAVLGTDLPPVVVPVGVRVPVDEKAGLLRGDGAEGPTILSMGDEGRIRVNASSASVPAEPEPTPEAAPSIPAVPVPTPDVPDPELFDTGRARPRPQGGTTL